MTLTSVFRATRPVFPVAVALLLAGCGASTMTLHVKGDERTLNTCGGKEPHPVVVRIYQLSDSRNFNRTTTESLWQKDVEALGADLVKKEELTLHPGESREVEIELRKETTFIGVAADFCKSQKDKWRQIYPMESGGSEITVAVHDESIVIEEH